MIKLFKIFGFLLVTLMLLITAGIIVLVVMFEPNDLKPIIVEQVYKTTGRTLIINGNIHWSLLPTLGFKINNAALNNKPGFSDQPLATITHARIDIAIKPLFQGKIHTKELVLDGLTLNLIKNKQGQRNWDGLIKKIESPVSQPAQASKSHDFKFHIPTILVTNAALSFHDMKTNHQSKISQLDFRAKNIQKENPFPIKASLNVFSNKPNIKGNIKLNGQLILKPKREGIKNLIAKIKLTGSSLPNKKLDALIKGQLVFLGSNQLMIKPMDIKVKGSTFGGYVWLDNIENWSGEFHGIIDQLNLDKWTDSSKSKIKLKTKKNSATKNYTAINNIFRKLNLRGKILIKKLIVNKLRLNNTEAKISAKQGIIKIAPITSQLYHGTYTGSAILNAKKAVPRFHKQGKLSNINFQPLIKDLANYNKITGTGNLSFNINSQGLDANTIKRTLNGQASFSIKNGAIKGIDIAHYLRAVRALINKKMPSKLKGTNQTDFGTLSGQAAIKNGVMTCNNLKLNSKTVVVDGRGTINFVTEKINYKLEAREPHVNPDSLATAPIIITGNFRNPDINLDTTRVMNKIQKKALKHLKEKAAEKIQDVIKENAGDIFKSLGW